MAYARMTGLSSEAAFYNTPDALEGYYIVAQAVVEQGAKGKVNIHEDQASGWISADISNYVEIPCRC